jgi:hypothetical protein
MINSLYEEKTFYKVQSVGDKDSQQTKNKLPHLTLSI